MFRCFSMACAAALLLVGPAFIPITSAWASTCTGEAHCTACSNCSRCAHCSSGGSCGVCAQEKKMARQARQREAKEPKTYRRNYDPWYAWKTPAAAKPTPSPKPSPTPDPALFHALHVKRTVIVAPQVGLRKTAKDTSARLQMLKKGATVIVLGMQAGHYKVMLLDNKTGYVPKKAVGGIDEVLTVKR